MGAPACGPGVAPRNGSAQGSTRSRAERAQDPHRPRSSSVTVAPHRPARPTARPGAQPAPGPPGPSAAADGPHPAIDRRLLVLLAFVGCASPLAVDLYLASFPAMARDLGTTPAMVRLTLTAYPQPSIGPGADRTPGSTSARLGTPRSSMTWRSVPEVAACTAGIGRKTREI